MRFLFIFTITVSGFLSYAQPGPHINELYPIDHTEETVICAFETSDKYYFVLGSYYRHNAIIHQPEGIIIGTLDKNDLTPSIVKRFDLPVPHYFAADAAYQDSTILIGYVVRDSIYPHQYYKLFSYHLSDSILWSTDVIDTTRGIGPYALTPGNGEWLLAQYMSGTGPRNLVRIKHVDSVGGVTDITPGALSPWSGIGSIRTDDSGNIYLVGSYPHSTMDEQVFVLSMDKHKQFRWYREFGHENYDYDLCSSLGADNHLYVIYNDCLHDPQGGYPNYCSYVTRGKVLRSDGVVLDSFVVTGNTSLDQTFITDMIVSPKNIVIYGYRYQQYTDKDGVILSMDYDGEIIWDRSYWYQPYRSQEEEFQHLFTTDSSYIVFGAIPVRTSEMNLYVDSLTSDFWYLELDSTGCLYSDSTFPGIDSIGYTLELVSGNKYVLTIVPGLPDHHFVRIKDIINASGFDLLSVNEDTVKFTYPSSNPISITIGTVIGCGYQEFVDTIEQLPTVVDLSSYRNTDFEIYPNPVHDKLIVLLPFVDGYLSLLNGSGMEVKNLPVNQRKMLVDVSNVPRGFYVLRWRNQYGTWSRKVVLD